MDKEDAVYINNGILLSHIKEWNNAICSSMDGLRDYHTKWSKSDKDKYMIKLLCGIKNVIKWTYFKWTYLQNGNRLTNIENTLWESSGGIN